MAFVTPTKFSLEELGPNDGERIRELFVRTVNLGMPGFVLRQMGPDRREARRRLVEAVSPVARFISRRENPDVARDILFGRAKLGLHVDMNPPSWNSEGTYININGVDHGAMNVGLLPLRPQLLEKARAGEELVESVWGTLDKNGEYLVDDALVTPAMYTAEDMRRGDLLVFLDWANVHGFETTESPRRSMAMLDFVCVTSGVEA